MNEYWWEMRVLRNASMHPEGLSRSQLRENTGLIKDPHSDPEGHLFSWAMKYLMPLDDFNNGFLEARTGPEGPLYFVSGKGKRKLAEYGGGSI
jgi:hypothetical protein